jgi:hypothetical protein
MSNRHLPSRRGGRELSYNGSEKGFRVRLHIAMYQDLAALVEDADVHHAGMQVDPAVKWVLRVVKSH